MASTNINIRTDTEIKNQAKQVFESLGLDLSTAINLFLRQAIQVKNLPFTLGALPEEKSKVTRTFQKKDFVSHYGVWKGKYSLPENFDDPLEDFKEYM
jgi:DNA-damage-inducible protein J